MNIAIVHYHLEKGGVTRVIENTIESFSKLPNSPNFVVLSGRKYTGNKIKNVKIIDGLDYSTPDKSISPKILKERMEDAAIEGLQEKPDLWHIHNHSLGKNPTLTKACSLIATAQYPVLLHPHDFAEDGRPSNFHFLKEVYKETYPTSKNIHYAVLNQRDLTFIKILLKNSASKAHILANAIPPPNKRCDAINKLPELPANLFLYPVRAVRRKNLGELVLLSSAYDDLYFANSLGPTNPAFTSIYNRWKKFSKNMELPITFGMGEQIDCTFEDFVNSASGVITTSIAEGFGLGFLEPWTFDKFLHGRNISEITEDFSKLGIKLNHMYNKIEIDLKHLKNSGVLKSKIKSVLNKFFSDYGQELPKNAEKIAYNSIVKNNMLDFGKVDELMQEEIILSVRKSEAAKIEIQNQAKIGESKTNILAENKNAVQENFSLNSYREKLFKIYLELCNTKHSKVEFVDGNNLLKSFLKPERLNLLRTN